MITLAAYAVLKNREIKDDAWILFWTEKPLRAQQKFSANGTVKYMQPKTWAEKPKHRGMSVT